MTQYNIIAESQEYTVVSEYEKAVSTSDAYQSEADLEKEFIHLLGEQGYEYLPIHTEADLISNLRAQLEKLNSYHFTDTEWEQFFGTCIANKNDDIVAKTAKIQEDYIQVLRRDTGESQNIYLIDKKNIHNNSVQVINQYVETEGKHDTRYDVSILVNGLPLVHVELKRRGVQLKEAFNQINRYQRDSFWAGCGLYEYIQIFVISNGTNTKYYSNTTRSNHLKEQETGGRNKSKKTSNSFEFSSFWADSNNKVITDLLDFTKTFFSKHTILNILTRYCVFTSEKMLMVMRPYQIAATERIIQRIIVANNYKQYGSIKGGGYIWHTTGSGKTLTSFKTAQLASRLPYIDKVLFVVDRKDLDYQTMKEYNRFEDGAANGNTSTSVLQRQLENKDKNGGFHDYRIIVTTIQKLSIFVQKNKGHEVFQKRVVIIFDECHRSNFGEMHTAITRNFKKYHLFGFTGTPIFAQNAGTGGDLHLKTTQQAFGDKLHTYTIVDAINDENVLPFRIDYINTIKEKDGILDKQISAIDREKAMASPERISQIVSYILDHFDQKTKRMAQEEKTASKRRKALERELDWVRMAPKARQAKGKARLNSYDKMLNEEQKEKEEKLEIFIPNGPRLGNKVIEAQHVAKAFGEKTLFTDLNFMLPPNGIIGVIGPNGAGKTTLFRMIMELEKADAGNFEVGETVKLAYVDQQHKDIDPAKTVYEVVSQGNELMRLGGRDVNARVYLSRFNFAGADQEKKCGVLSGGERNRLHLALALKQEGNVLLLDEPTNDIDVNTLRALEEGLEAFAGCAVVISHDRWFLDRICTHILAFEGDGNVFFFEGSYSDYEINKAKRLGIEEPKRIRYRGLNE